MAWGLTVRIFQHLFDRGWLKEGDLVADCFGGVGVTALVASAFGCPCIIVELEEKFCKLAEDNFSLHREQWEKMGKPYPVCIQGDSRQFASLIQEAARAITCSPPYATSATGHKAGTGISSTEARIERLKAAGYDAEAMLTPGRRAHGNLGEMEHYSANPANMGNLPEGSHEAVVDACITSPPYENSMTAGGNLIW